MPKVKSLVLFWVFLTLPTLVGSAGSEWGRDPFVFGEASKNGGGLVLNGIVWDEASPSAIIDGNVVRIGDEVGGSRVIDIQKERVILGRDTGIYELNLQQRGRE